MIESIDPFYHKKAARLFQVIQYAALPLSSLVTYFINNDPSDARLEDKLVSKSDTEHQC